MAIIDALLPEFDREMGLTRRALERLDLAASYTYQDAENRSSGADTDVLQNRPEHKFSLRADFAVNASLRVGGNYLYAADSYTL